MVYFKTWWLQLNLKKVKRGATNLWTNPIEIIMRKHPSFQTYHSKRNKCELCWNSFNNTISILTDPDKSRFEYIIVVLCSQPENKSYYQISYEHNICRIITKVGICFSRGLEPNWRYQTKFELIDSSISFVNSKFKFDVIVVDLFLVCSLSKILRHFHLWIYSYLTLWLWC